MPSWPRQFSNQLAQHLCKSLPHRRLDDMKTKSFNVWLFDPVMNEFNKMPLPTTDMCDPSDHYPFTKLSAVKSTFWQQQDIPSALKRPVIIVANVLYYFTAGFALLAQTLVFLRLGAAFAKEIQIFIIRSGFSCLHFELQKVLPQSRESEKVFIFQKFSHLSLTLILICLVFSFCLMMSILYSLKSRTNLTNHSCGEACPVNLYCRCVALKNKFDCRTSLLGSPY